MKYLYILFFLPLFPLAQGNLHNELFENYDQYRETSIEHRRFKHQDLQPIIDSIGKLKDFEVSLLGNSIQGRSISMISIGEGSVNVLLWSQMHGDEPTATAAIFDILNYLKTDKTLIQNLKVHFIPMLNPDGAETFSRRNAIGIDINRDALQLQSPESRILKRARDSLEADFGFNLHDQSKYNNPKSLPVPATVSFLAPAFNHEKDINQTRGDAMRVIVEMNAVIQRYAKGQVGRYSDEFEPRAFGDNLQKWGTSTILIESGGYQNDPEKQFIRKLNFVSILSALHTISTQKYTDAGLDDYLSIPRNDRKLFDLKIENLTFNYLGNDYTIDIGIRHYEIENKDHSDFYYKGRIVELGDLSTFHAYEMLNAQGFDFKLGETYPKILENFEAFKELDVASLLKQGYTSVTIQDLPKEIQFTPSPINIINLSHISIPKNNSMPKPPLSLGSDASFILLKNQQVVYAVINGFVYQINDKIDPVGNGIVK